MSGSLKNRQSQKTSKQRDRHHLKTKQKRLNICVTIRNLGHKPGSESTHTAHTGLFTKMIKGD